MESLSKEEGSPGDCTGGRGARFPDQAVSEVGQGLEHPIHLVLGVVVAEADPNGAAGIEESEALHDGDRVVVPVPDVDAASRQFGRRLQRVLIADADRERRGPLVEPRFVGDAPQANAGDVGRPSQEAGGQSALVGADRAEARNDRVAPSRPPGIAVRPADVRQVVDGGDQARESLVVLGARLPPLGRLVRRRAELVRGPRLEQPATHGQHAQVRPEELVRRAREDVGVQPVQIERAMLREVHAVDGDERSHGVDAPDQLGGRWDRAHGVRCERERDQPRAIGQQPRRTSRGRA